LAAGSGAPDLAASCGRFAWSAGIVANLIAVRAAGRECIAAAAQARLASLIRYARGQSPFYHDRLRGSRGVGLSLDRLPIVTRHELMGAFDEWSTDRRVTREAVRRFVADPERIGQPFLGEYGVWKSSGTSGEPGMFVHDAFAQNVYDGLVALHLAHLRLGASFAEGLVSEGGRAALVCATSDHYAAIASWRRASSGWAWVPSCAISVTEPLAEIVGRLNAFKPALLAGYPTMLVLLARERVAGRLHIAPTTVWCGGERLSTRARREIEEAFGAPLANEYGASEALSIGYEGPCGWMHVNADWVILEPIQSDGSPTPPGTLSQTTLVTNLANRVQPIIRYDLGDRVLVNPEPCTCGSPLPAIRVEGRCGDFVHLVSSDGHRLDLAPLAIETAVEAAGVYGFQVVCDSPRRIRLRFGNAETASREVAFARARSALGTLFERHGLHGIAVELDEVQPARTPHSGKLRAVVARGTRHGGRRESVR
jgi:phenylacetate-CoA ligase